MKTSEHFALDQWLSEYPRQSTYEDILSILKTNCDSWTHEEITVWEVVQDFPLGQVAQFIEDTKQHFERVTS